VEEYLADNQLTTPSIGEKMGKTTVAACIGTGPFLLKATGKPRCLREHRQTFPKNYTAGVVTLGYPGPGSSTKATMTVHKSAVFSHGVHSSVEFALPPIDGDSVGMIARASVLNAVGYNFSALAVATTPGYTLPLYLPVDAKCGLRYSITSCSVTARGSIPIIATGWLLAMNAQNQTVTVPLDAVTLAERASQLEGILEYHAAGSYDAFCDPYDEWV